MKFIDCSKSILTEDEIKEIIGGKKFIPLKVLESLIDYHAAKRQNPYHNSRFHLFIDIHKEIFNEGSIKSEIKQEAKEIPIKNFPFKGV